MSQSLGAVGIPTKEEQVIKGLMVLAFGMASSLAVAQQSTEVDPAHYKLVFENECVRVVRGAFGPGEQSAAPYQSHGAVVVALTDIEGKVTKEGKTVDVKKQAGEAWWSNGGNGTSVKNGGKAIEYVAVVPKGNAECRN